MRNLLDLLGRFTKSLNKNSLVKEGVSTIIQKNTKVSLLPENFSLKDGVLTISTSPSAKNEIILKEESIKSELRETYNIFVSKMLFK